ncbi:MAG: hypothetical protein RL111_2425 [Pseudomonadota bacterium]
MIQSFSQARPTQSRPGHMFTPSQADVRRFFCSVLAKQKQGTPLDPMEALAGDWISLHPEYHEALSDEAQALARMYDVEAGQTNPFLHLSMHLTLSEQYRIDQPKGVKQALDGLTVRMGSLHRAHHEAMECLGQMVWESQRSGRPPDGHAYVDALLQRASRK